MLRRFRTAAALTAAALLIPLAGCSGGSADDSGGPVALDYWLWDDKQLPAYQECATAFTKANPGITVKFAQTAWDQYWQNLTTQLASGSAPDVWTDHASYYPQFVTSNQILDIQPFVEKDKVDLGQYQAGLADLFVKDGKRYGLPKDWDTMALVYNTKLVKEPGDLTWNPTDGGTFEKAVAAATVDAAGRNGLDPAFDKTKVRVYGFLPEWGDGAQGQNGWGDLAVSNGFTYLDKNPWGTKYNFDDPKLAETIAWFKRLIDSGDGTPRPVPGGVLLPPGRVAILHGLGDASFYRHGQNSWSPTGWRRLSEPPLRVPGSTRLVTADDPRFDDPHPPPRLGGRGAAG